MSVSKNVGNRVAEWSRRWIENQQKVEDDYKRRSTDLIEQGFIEIPCYHNDMEKVQWLRDNKIFYVVIPRIVTEDGGIVGAYDVEVGQVFVAGKEPAMRFKLVWGGDA